MKLTLLLALLASIFAIFFFVHNNVSHDRQTVGLMPVENFRLLDHEGNSHELYYYSDYKAIVLIWQGNGCPIIQQAYPEIEKLKAKYAKKRVLFLLVNANSQDDRQSIKKELLNYGEQPPVLKDETQWISRSLKITRTAEVLLIDPKKWDVIYRGAIDDSLGYETKKVVGIRHYLEEALDSFLKNENIETPETPVKGCLITYVKTIGQGKDRSISYSKDIVPILSNKCMNCHVQGGIAPWAMKDYKTVRGWNAMMREVLRTKRMPPWFADPEIGKFSNDISLTVDEEKMLIEWLEMGSPKETNEEDPLPALTPPSSQEWQLGIPDQIYTNISREEKGSMGGEEYRVIEVPLDLPEARWLRALEIKTDNPDIVHHILVGLNKTSYPLTEYRGLKGGTWALDGDFGVYAPGLKSYMLYPKGVGFYLPENATLKIVSHTKPKGGRSFNLNPKIGLYFYSVKPEHEIKNLLLKNKNLYLAPNKKNQIIEASFYLPENMTFYAIGPHMHLRGRSYKMDVVYPDGKKEALLSVPNFQGAWQQIYYFQKPKFLPKNSLIYTQGIYDNSTQNAKNPNPKAIVKYGKFSNQEMFLTFIFVQFEN